jgi:[ribosomal protein S5]-alanine N-acetyltransferase
MHRPGQSLLTRRLRLIPIGPSNAADLWLGHNDDAVVPWYDGWRPSRQDADHEAQRVAESWRLHGVHKWMAYDRETGEVVGRGGLSRTPIDDDWGQIYEFLPDEPWAREPYECGYAGVMFWLRWKTFWGSYVRLTCCSRSQQGP